MGVLEFQVWGVRSRTVLEGSSSMKEWTLNHNMDPFQLDSYLKGVCNAFKAYSEKFLLVRWVQYPVPLDSKTL